MTIEAVLPNWSVLPDKRTPLLRMARIADIIDRVGLE
jgi:hypothetical protein